MALGLYFQSSGFTPDVCDEMVRQLERTAGWLRQGAGLHLPLRDKGRESHSGLRYVGVHGAVREVRRDAAAHHEQAGRRPGQPQIRDRPQHAERPAVITTLKCESRGAPATALGSPES